MTVRLGTPHEAPLGRSRRAGAVTLVHLFLLNLLVVESVFAEKLEERRIVLKGSAVSVPRSYGTLVDVVENNQIHYLYFEDAEGTIRIVLIGQRGTSVKANQELEILSPSVYVLSRNEDFSPRQSPDYK